jgi:hypothetical protein
MALMSKKEFAGKCGMKTKQLAVYIKRGKVLVDDEEMIDDNNLQNVDFYKHHSSKPKRTTEIKSEGVAKPKTKPVKASKKEQREQSEKTETLYDLEKEKKSLDIETNRKRNELLSMELAKKSGKLIPTSDVKALFAQHSKSITVSFGQFIEGFLSEIGKRSKLNANQIAEMRGRMIVMLNQSVDEAVDSTRKSLENLRSELSNAKE